MRQLAAKLLRENYLSIAKDLLGPLQAVLATARAEFGGDLDKFIVLLEVSMRTVEDKRLSDLSTEEFWHGTAKAYPSLGANIRSVAQASGIPRETVRRKVLELVDDGWIERRGHTLSLAPKASQQLTKVRDAIVDLAGRNYMTVLALAERDTKG